MTSPKMSAYLRRCWHVHQACATVANPVERFTRRPARTLRGRCPNARLIAARVVGNDGGHFDFQLGLLFDQRRNGDGRHRRKMPTHYCAVNATERAQVVEIFTPIDDVPRHSYDMLRTRARFREYGNDVLQREPRLLDEIVRFE